MLNGKKQGPQRLQVVGSHLDECPDPQQQEVDHSGCQGLRER